MDNGLGLHSTHPTVLFVCEEECNCNCHLYINNSIIPCAQYPDILQSCIKYWDMLQKCSIVIVGLSERRYLYGKFRIVCSKEQGNRIF